MAHSAELCSFFAYSVDYCYGNVVICFDTFDNGLLHAKRHEVHTVKEWDAMLSSQKDWQNARYYLQRDKLAYHNPHTAAT